LDAFDVTTISTPATDERIFLAIAPAATRPIVSRADDRPPPGSCVYHICIVGSICMGGDTSAPSHHSLADVFVAHHNRDRRPKRFTLKYPERISQVSASFRGVVILLDPDAYGLIPTGFPRQKFPVAGQLSITTPTPPPWDSPKVVTRNRCPKVLLMSLEKVRILYFS